MVDAEGAWSAPSLDSGTEDGIAMRMGVLSWPDAT